MPQALLGMSNSRLEPAPNSGPPKGPVALRVSATRHGVTGMNCSGGGVVELSGKDAAGVMLPTVAVAVSVPTLVGMATTEACPLGPLVTLAGENLNPVPLNLTTAPGTASPFESLTRTVRGFGYWEKAGAVWADPETALIAAGG